MELWYPRPLARGDRTIMAGDGPIGMIVLGQGRQDDHADGPVPRLRFVPRDKQGAAGPVRRRIEDHGNVLRKPGIALLNVVVNRWTLVVHIVTQVGGNEVVARDRAVLQVGREL